jgi:hypothetical protein
MVHTEFSKCQGQQPHDFAPHKYTKGSHTSVHTGSSKGVNVMAQQWKGKRLKGTRCLCLKPPHSSFHSAKAKRHKDGLRVRWQQSLEIHLFSRPTGCACAGVHTLL